MDHSEKESLILQRAIRLIFRYQGKNIHLLSKNTLDTLVPPSDPLEVRQGEVGFWLEIRDRKNQVCYRKVMFNPIMYAVDRRTDDINRSGNFQDVNEPSGEFVVVVPQIEGARSISFLSNQFEKKGAVRPVRRIAQFDLTK